MRLRDATATNRDFCNRTIGNEFLANGPAPVLFPKAKPAAAAAAGLPVGETGVCKRKCAFAGNRLQGAKRPKLGGRRIEARRGAAPL